MVLYRSREGGLTYGKWKRDFFKIIKDGPLYEMNSRSKTLRYAWISRIINFRMLEYASDVMPPTRAP